MKYTIITLNDDRFDYKKKIRANVPFEEIELPAVDGSQVDVMAELEARGLRSNWHHAKMGEYGVWLSNFDRWQYVSEMDEPLIVFEDDAVVNEDFIDYFTAFYRELPEDFDFAALWVPDNQRIDYTYLMEYNERGTANVVGHLEYQDSMFRVSLRCARTYQGYGMVALMYSPEGGRKLVELSRERGIDLPVDCFIFEQSNAKRVNGYAPTPLFAKIVGYDWAAQSQVQDTERVI